MRAGANLEGQRKGRWVPVSIAGVILSLLGGRGVGAHSHNQEAQPELQVEEITAEELEKEEQDIPVIELVPVPVKPLTPEERELRKFRRFLRGLEEFLAEERIVVKKGIYIGADSVFEIRRRGGPTPDLPFAVWFGNAEGYRDLRLRKVDIHGPDNALLYSFSPNKILPSIREEIELKIAQEEKLERLLKEAKLLLDKEIREKERERMREIKKEVWSAWEILFPEIVGPPYPESTIDIREMREKIYHQEASLDLTPYLREVGDKATITVRADFIYEAGSITVEIPFNFRLNPPLPDP